MRWRISIRADECVGVEFQCAFRHQSRCNKLGLPRRGESPLPVLRSRGNQRSPTAVLPSALALNATCCVPSRLERGHQELFSFVVLFFISVFFDVYLSWFTR